MLQKNRLMCSQCFVCLRDSLDQWVAALHPTPSGQPSCTRNFCRRGLGPCQVPASGSAGTISSQPRSFWFLFPCTSPFLWLFHYFTPILATANCFWQSSFPWDIDGRFLGMEGVMGAGMESLFSWRSRHQFRTKCRETKLIQMTQMGFSSSHSISSGLKRHCLPGMQKHFFFSCWPSKKLKQEPRVFFSLPQVFSSAFLHGVFTAGR